MKFLYFLVALPLLAVAAPAPVPSGYYRGVKRDGDSVLAKRQVTVADLKRRAYDSDDYKKEDYKKEDYKKEDYKKEGYKKEDYKKYKPSGYYYPRATDAA